jgi:senataxin
MVLVDEAAQATEVATLQPLIHGARHVVMVGDPLQLPPTIFSEEAKALALERSLFERLQEAGCPVLLLEVQYRMHPAIRLWPSNFFYGGRLQDGESVTARPAPSFYNNDLLKPYVFFDVSSGTHARPERSYENAAEAALVVSLFWELRCEEHAAAAGSCTPPELMPVTAISFYQAQCDLLRREFDLRLRAMGADPAMAPKIATTDSCQGKQRQVVRRAACAASAAACAARGAPLIEPLDQHLSTNTHALLILCSPTGQTAAANRSSSRAFAPPWAAASVPASWRTCGGSTWPSRARSTRCG